MAPPKKWQIASGGLVAAMAFGTGAAFAEPGIAKPLPKLEDVVNVTRMSIRPDLDDVVSGAHLQQLVGDDSPLSQLSAASPDSELSVSPVSPVSPESVSQPSTDSVSQPSVESVSQPSVDSVSQPSVESVSVPSAESDD